MVSLDFPISVNYKAGRDVYWTPVLKIATVSIGLVKSQDKPNGEELIFLHFEGQSRKLGLNSTNAKTMTSLSGSPVPMRWVGLTIQLYVDPKAKYPKGETGPAIRTYNIMIGERRRVAAALIAVP